MLSLEKHSDATEIVQVFSGTTKGFKRRKPKFTVYFTHEEDADHSTVAEAKGVLKLHKDDLKKELKINEHEYHAVCDMLDGDAEPEPDHPLKVQYWSMRERFEQYLRREMFLGDTDDRFELNFPRSKAHFNMHR